MELGSLEVWTLGVGWLSAIWLTLYARRWKLQSEAAGEKDIFFFFDKRKSFHYSILPVGALVLYSDCASLFLSLSADLRVWLAD